MLCYSTLHPEWDGQAFPHAQEISVLLDTVARNHARRTGGCVERLEEYGIFLGNGGFSVALIQKNPKGALEEEDEAWRRQIIGAAKAHLRETLWYLFTVSGQLYLLVCFPRLAEGDGGEAAAMETLKTGVAGLFETIAPPGRIILGDMQYGAAGVFRCFNNLHHAMEYYDFQEDAPRLIHLDSEQQLHGAFVEDLSAYRLFSVAIADRLVQEDCDIFALSQRVCQTILERGAPSMESVHHHTQIFMLTFTEHLGRSGLVDSAYIRHHGIVYRSLAFETKGELQTQMEALLGELYHQHRTLKAVGRQKRVQDIREYIQTHIAQPELSVQGLSEEFGVSAAQIAKQFRYYYGLSPYKFLQRTRYAYAQKLLSAHPQWRVAEIAAAAGYTDLSTMYRAFRQFADSTPGSLKEAANLGSVSAHTGAQTAGDI